MMKVSKCRRFMPKLPLAKHLPLCIAALLFGDVVIARREHENESSRHFAATRRLIRENIGLGNVLHHYSGANKMPNDEGRRMYAFEERQPTPTRNSPLLYKTPKKYMCGALACGGISYRRCLVCLCNVWRIAFL